MKHNGMHAEPTLEVSFPGILSPFLDFKWG